MKKVDVLILLGGGIVRQEDKFYPTEYFDSLTFGITGGKYRVLAALELYKKGIFDTIVFTTGIYKKMIDIYGSDIPTEASVYQDEFMRLIKEESLITPEIILEDKSDTTLTNLIEIRKIISKNCWLDIALLSSDFHLPRVEALWKMLQEKEKIDCLVSFISAEQVLKKYLPGKYDVVIDRAYSSAQGKNRLEMEKQGLDDIKAGKYATREYQLIVHEK